MQIRFLTLTSIQTKLSILSYFFICSLFVKSLNLKMFFPRLRFQSPSFLSHSLTTVVTLSPISLTLSCYAIIMSSHLPPISGGSSSVMSRWEEGPSVLIKSTFARNSLARFWLNPHKFAIRDWHLWWQAALHDVHLIPWLTNPHNIAPQCWVKEGYVNHE